MLYQPQPRRAYTPDGLPTLQAPGSSPPDSCLTLGNLVGLETPPRSAPMPDGRPLSSASTATPGLDAGGSSGVTPYSTVSSGKLSTTSSPFTPRESRHKKSGGQWWGAEPTSQKQTTPNTPSSMQDRKVFVGGVPQEMHQERFHAAFSVFARVKRAWLQKCGASTHGHCLPHRGFGFVIFQEDGAVDGLLGPGAFSRFVMLSGGLRVEVKRAVPSNRGQGPQRDLGGGGAPEQEQQPLRTPLRRSPLQQAHQEREREQRQERQAPRPLQKQKQRPDPARGAQLRQPAPVALQLGARLPFPHPQLQLPDEATKPPQYSFGSNGFWWWSLNRPPHLYNYPGDMAAMAAGGAALPRPPLAAPPPPRPALVSDSDARSSEAQMVLATTPHASHVNFYPNSGIGNDSGIDIELLLDILRLSPRPSRRSFKEEPK